jgi:hypothetical protein
VEVPWKLSSYLAIQYTPSYSYLAIQYTPSYSYVAIQYTPSYSWLGGSRPVVATQNGSIREGRPACTRIFGVLPEVEEDLLSL